MHAGLPLTSPQLNFTPETKRNQPKHIGDPTSRYHKANHRSTGHGASDRPIGDGGFCEVHVVSVIRHPCLYRRPICPGNIDGGCRSARVDHIDGQLPIGIDESRRSQAIAPSCVYSDGTRSYGSAILGERPEAFRYLIRISLDQYELLVVIVIRRPILCTHPLVISVSTCCILRTSYSTVERGKT